MLICVCCPDPRITCGQENAIEIPDDCLEDFTMYDAEVIRNDQKRNIKILKKEYLLQARQELNRLTETAQ